MLIHGFFSTAMVNWVRYGHAATIAGLGYRVVMPDLRGAIAPSRTMLLPIRATFLPTMGSPPIEHLGHRLRSWWVIHSVA